MHSVFEWLLILRNESIFHFLMGKFFFLCFLIIRFLLLLGFVWLCGTLTVVSLWVVQDYITLSGSLVCWFALMLYIICVALMVDGRRVVLFTCTFMRWSCFISCNGLLPCWYCSPLGFVLSSVFFSRQNSWPLMSTGVVYCTFVLCFWLGNLYFIYILMMMYGTCVII